MKNLVAIIVLSLLGAVTFAQETKSIKFNSASLSSGKGSLSSGLLFTADFNKGDDLINITLGERDIYFLYLKKVAKFYVGPSVEFYHNVPTIGQMTNVPVVNKGNFSLSLLNWYGVSAGIPGQRADFSNWQLLFFYQSINASYKRLSFSGAALWYKEWGYLFEFKYKQPLTEKISTFVSTGYNFYADGDYLFKLGIVYHL
ncbi:MAG TPA: hypothetical protein VFD51_03375 [Patescibacteria group bacterium]|nr:hypothetical protein [Patescibacteria group bacterium]